MDLRELEAAIEGILFASGEPVPINRIADVLGLDGKLVSDAADRLADTYVLERRGIRLIRLENSIQLCSAPELAELIRRVLETRKPPQLSQTALEVLAIVAYFQPVTRAFVEKMRGVDSSYTVSSLEEKGLVEPCGKLKVPGRPTVYRTTPDFLRCFGLKSINDLPKLPDSGISEGQLELQNAISALIEQEETQCSGPAS